MTRMTEYYVEHSDGGPYAMWGCYLYQAMAERVARRECRAGFIAPLWRVRSTAGRVSWAGRHGPARFHCPTPITQGDPS